MPEIFAQIGLTVASALLIDQVKYLLKAFWKWIRSAVQRFKKRRTKKHRRKKGK